jgi:hypothetical protein
MNTERLSIFLIGLPLLLLLCMQVPSASAQQATYLALRPDSAPYCFYVNFGEGNTGEYTLFVNDPGFPSKPWASIHTASFTASKSNVVTVPVCISAVGRKIGDEVLINVTVQSPPAKNTTHSYGVCVRRTEDIDQGGANLNPCAASSTYTDVFSASLTEESITAKPGEVVSYGLSVASDYPVKILISKTVGPSMVINASKLYMPGSWLVGIDVTASPSVGEYPFSLDVSTDGCTLAFCQKTVEGKLIVSTNTTNEGFAVFLSPEVESASGATPKVFRLTVRNFEAQQTFKVTVDVPEGLQSDFMGASETIGKGVAKTFSMTMVPKSEEAALYTIKASVENKDGMKKTLTASLTVKEVESDLNDDGDPVTVPDPGGYTNNTGLTKLQKQKAPKKNTTLPDVPDVPASQPVSIWVIIIAAAAASAVALFFIFKRAKVVKGDEPSYFDEKQEP